MASDKGIFISVLPRLEVAALTAAATQMRTLFTKLGVDIKSSMDAQMAAASKAADAVARSETVATDARIRSDKAQGDLQVAEARRNEVRAAGAEATSSRMIRAEVAYQDALARSEALAVRSARATDAAVATRAKQADVLAASAAASAGAASKAWNTAGLVATGALITIGAESAKTAAQVEQNMNRIVVMHQESAASIGGMTQQIYALANQVPFSVQKLSEGLSLIEQHGYRGQDALNALMVSAKAATAVGADLSSTVGGLTTQLDDMGYQGKKGPELLNDMNTMASQLVVSLKDLKNLNPAELFTSLHSVEPSAKAYMAGLAGNQASAQVMAAMDVLSQTGMSQEQSAPNLARLISTLGAIRPGSNTFNTLGQLGVKQEDIAQQMQNQGFLPVIQTIQNAINAKTNKDTGLVDIGWQYNNAQVNDLIAKNKAGLSAGGQDFLKNHPDIESGLARPFSLKKDLAKTGLSGEEGQDIITLAQWESMVHGPQNFIKKGGTADITQGQAYQLLFGTGDVARTGLILGQNPQGNIDQAKNITKEGTPDNFDKAFKQAMESTTNQWKQLGASAGSLAGRIGNDLLPLLKSVIEGFTHVVDFLGKHKVVADALIHSMEVIAAAWAGSKLINAIDGVRTAYAKLGSSATKAGATLEASSAEAGTNLKTGSAKLSTAEATAGTALETGATTSSTEMKAGATKLTTEELTAGATLEKGAASASAELEAGASKASAGLLARMGAGTPLAAAALFGPDLQQWERDHIPGSSATQDYLPLPGTILMNGDAWLQGKSNSPVGNMFGLGDKTTSAQDNAAAALQRAKDAAAGKDPQSVADEVNRRLAASGVGPAAVKPPPPPDAGGPDDVPDHSADTGSGAVADDGSGGSKATATAPNITAAAPFHPIDTDPAHKPAGYETYDQWISSQKAIADALTRVDDTATAQAAAQAKMTDLIKKGHASQEEWNSTQEALNKANRDNAKAKQDETIAETKAREEANKVPKSKKGSSSSGLGDEDPFEGAMSKATTLWGKLAAFGTTFLTEMALGNPYGKLQSAKLGSDPSSPMYVSDVSSLNGQGFPSLSGLNLNNLPNAHGAHPQIGVLAALANKFGVNLTSGKDDHPIDGGFHPLGEAGDFGNGDKTPEETNFANFLAQNFGPYIAELIHTGPGTATNIKNGRPTPVIDQPGSVYNTGQAGYHGDHDHVAITDQQAPGFMEAVNQYLASQGGGGLSSGSSWSADWNAIAKKESGGNWSINTGNGYQGGLQFTPSSWAAAGGTQYAPSANLASPTEQALIAENLLKMQGPGAWPNTFTPGSSGPGDLSDVPGYSGEGGPFGRGPKLDFTSPGADSGTGPGPAPSLSSGDIAGIHSLDGLFNANSLGGGPGAQASRRGLSSSTVLPPGSYLNGAPSTLPDVINQGLDGASGPGTINPQPAGGPFMAGPHPAGLGPTLGLNGTPTTRGIPGLPQGPQPLSGYYANAPMLPGMGPGGGNGPHGGYHDQHMPPPGGGATGPQTPGRSSTPGAPLGAPDQRPLNSTVDNRQPGQGAPGAGGGGGGGGGGFQIPGAVMGAAQAAAPLLDAIAPGAGEAAQKGMQLANRAAQYVGQLAGIGVEGLFETFGLNDSAIGDPSKSLFGKFAMGLAGAHPSKENNAGKTAAPLKPDDSKDPKNKKSDAPQGPMINIENQHINNNQNNGQVEKDMNRVLMGQGMNR